MNQHPEEVVAPGAAADDRAEGAARSGEVRWFGVVLLIAHAALLTLGAVSLWRIGGGWWVGAVAAAVFAVVYAAMWRFWLAPGSRRQLLYRERLTLNLVAGPAVVVLGSLAGLWLPALLAVSMILLCDALNQRRA